MFRQRVIYNNYEFPFIKSSLAEQVRMSEDGITPIGTSYKHTFSGVITATDPNALQLSLLQARAQLAQPRQSFTADWYDGTEYVNFWSCSDGDDGWGPTPGELQIRTISSGKAAWYSWSIEYFKKQCYGSDCSLSDSSNGVLSLSRQWEHSVDDAGFTTRTVSGLLRVRQGYSVNADSYRQMVTPDVPAWYRRTSANYTQSPNGLELNYSITDVEQHWTLPKPVIKGHANYAVSYDPLGLMVTHTLTGEFTGASSATKFQLYEAMSNLVLAKFPDYSGATDGPQLMFGNVQVTESVYDNILSFNISGRVPGGGDQDFNSALLRMYVAPPGSNGSAQAPNAYGSSGDGFSSGIVAPGAVAFEACSSATGPGGTTYPTNPVNSGEVAKPSNPGVPTNDPGNPTTDRPTSPQTADPPPISMDHQTRPYLEFRETLSYEIDNKIVVFVPMADDSDSAPFVQRTGSPTLTIIQSGYWIRATKDSTAFQAPQPYGYNQTADDDSPKFVVMSSSIKPQNAEPMGVSGWFRCTMFWTYVIRANYRLDSALSGSLYNPADPRPDDPIDPEILGDAPGTSYADQWNLVERLDHS